MLRVLFVCLGNICRSPMAEGLFAHKVRLAGLEGEIEADSAGTGHWHLGKEPHEGTRRVLQQNRIAHSHRARQITRADLDTFDYIITMDEENLANVRALGAARAAVVPLMEFAPNMGALEVPDPYYTGEYEEVYRLVDEATDGLLATLRRDHGL